MSSKTETFCIRLLTFYYTKWTKLEPWPKSFAVIAVTNYLCLFALAIEPLFEDTSDAIITRTLIFCIIFLFQTLHLFFGIFHENIYELYAVMVSQFIICIAVVFRSISVRDWDLYSILLLGYAIFFQFVYIVYAIPLYKANAWAFYRKIGASLEVRKKYQHYLVLHVLFKLDCMASLVNILVFEHDMLQSYPWLSDLVFGLLSIIYYVLGRLAFRQESIPLVLSFWCFSTVIFVFMGYGFYSILTSHPWSDFILLELSNLSFGLMFFVSGLFLFIVRIFLIIQSIITYNYFGEGLAQLENKIERYWDRDEESIVND